MLAAAVTVGALLPRCSRAPAHWTPGGAGQGEGLERQQRRRRLRQLGAELRARAVVVSDDLRTFSQATVYARIREPWFAAPWLVRRRGRLAGVGGRQLDTAGAGARPPACALVRGHVRAHRKLGVRALASKTRAQTRTHSHASTRAHTHTQIRARTHAPGAGHRGAARRRHRDPARDVTGT